MVLDMAKTEEQKEHHMAWNAWKRCCKKVDFQGEHFTGIHDRFLRHSVYRESQFAIGGTERKCTEMDEIAMEAPSPSQSGKRIVDVLVALTLKMFVKILRFNPPIATHLRGSMNIFVDVRAALAGKALRDSLSLVTLVARQGSL